MLEAMASHVTLAWTPGPIELIIIAMVGLLIFGRRLPEVGRSVGRGIVEFKKGLSGVGDQMDEASKKPRLEGQDAGQTMEHGEQSHASQADSKPST